MRILDLYLTKKFLAILLYTSVAFIAIFVVVDFIEHLDKFLESDAGPGVIFFYYLYYIPYIIILTLPVNMLLSSLFSLGTMAQYNELVAALSSGISLYRLVLPLLILGMLISALSGLAGETLVPQSNRLRLDIYRYDIRNQPREKRGTERKIAMQDYDGRQVSILYYDVGKQRANNVSILWRKGNRITERWDVKYMQWQDSINVWQMHHITKRIFSNSGETVRRLNTTAYTDTRILPNDLLDLQLKPEEMNYA